MEGFSDKLLAGIISEADQVKLLAEPIAVFHNPLGELLGDIG